MTQGQAAFVGGVFVLLFLVIITYKPDDFKPDPARDGTGGFSLGKLLGLFRFFCALLVGSIYRLWKLVQATGTEAAGVWRALTNKHQYVSDELKAQRMAICRKCPLFFAPLQTCGSPLRKTKDGCFCYMPLAAGAYHDCYIFENGTLFSDEPGWPPNLNSSVIDL